MFRRKWRIRIQDPDTTLPDPDPDLNFLFGGLPFDWAYTKNNVIKRWTNLGLEVIGVCDP